MTQYFDSRGQAVRFGNEIGKGGEGSVFELAGNPRLVAKIYKDRPVALDKAEKLRHMVAIATDDLTKFAALPIDSLSESPQSPIVGLIMPRVSGHTEIHNLYSPAHRKIKFADKDWSFLIHVAMNCAATFDALHQKDIVIGDVNQGNVLVSERGTVFLIDCDSFQLKSHGRLFPCEVGVPHFTPPELQGRSFRGVERTSNHDLFGLGVIVFHLLCMGRHPYAGRFLGSGDMPIEKAISDFRYAYGKDSTLLQMVPPPQTLDLSTVMPKLAGLFERAFLKSGSCPNGRPRASEWYGVLREFRDMLTTCPKDLGHKYPKTLATCPWCNLQKSGAPNFFISVTAKTFATGTIQLTFDIRSLWLQIEGVALPLKFDETLLPNKNHFKVLPTPIPDEMQRYIAFSRLVRGISISGLAGCICYFFSHILALASFSVSLVFGAWWLVLESISGLYAEKCRRRARLVAAQENVNQLKLEVAVKLDAFSDEFSQLQSFLAATKRQIGALKPQYENELNQLRSQRERMQRDAFLQSVFISDHKIDKIGPGRLSQLSSYGIETAYDIDWGRIQNITGFGDAITSNLIEWRRKIETQFRFDPTQGVSPSDLQSLVTRFVQINQHLTSTLEDGLIQIKRIRNESLATVSLYQQKISNAIGALAQAEADTTSFV